METTDKKGLPNGRFQFLSTVRAIRAYLNVLKPFLSTLQRVSIGYHTREKYLAHFIILKTKSKSPRRFLISFQKFLEIVMLFSFLLHPKTFDLG